MRRALRIVIATGNPHKVEELRAMLALEGVEFVGLGDVPAPAPLHEPEETGTTFEENAAIKACSYAQQTGLWCLADDSGLEVDALGGRPGVISSHYGTDGRETGVTRAERDQANNARVLRELEGVPMEQRAARFVCVMVLARVEDGANLPPSLLPPLARGTMEGCIGLPPRVPSGFNGFGYDPLFLVAPTFTRTSAELSSEEKNLLSHRAAAAATMLEHIRLLRDALSARA